MWVQKKTNIQTNKQTYIQIYTYFFGKQSQETRQKPTARLWPAVGTRLVKGIGAGGGGGHGPHTIFKSMFWPPHFWGQLAQVETISQSYIHRNTYIHRRSHTTQCTSTVSCGITSPPLESSTTVKPFTVRPKSAYNFIYD